MLILQTLQGLLTKRQYFWKLVILKKCLVSFCIFYRLNVDINLHLSEIIVMERIFLHIHPIKNSYKTCFKKSSMTLQVYTCKVMDDFRTKSWKSCHRFYKIRHGKYQSRMQDLQDIQSIHKQVFTKPKRSTMYTRIN